MRKDKPSRTAYKVALAVLTLGAKPGMDKVLPPGIVPATRQLLLASGVAWPQTIRWAESRRSVSVYEAFDWMLPGQFEAFAHRKAFFERQVRDGISSGATQVLVLGAGYDTLGWRLAPEFPGVSFFEIDHPATARLKAKGIAAMGCPDNLYLLAEDLGDKQLIDVLTEHRLWDANVQTVILAEGLVMYLLPKAVLKLFCQCAELVGHGSRIAFSYIPMGPNGRPDAGRWTGLMLWLQKAIGEPWVWSVRAEELDAYLHDVGWQYAPELTKASGMYGVERYAVAAK
jgi:methyltransferase (TIGR00027 family)